MTKDPFSQRFEIKRKQQQLDELAHKGMTEAEREEERQRIKEAPKVEPIKGEKTAARNDPCPCGSGKKFKQCCGKGK